MKHAYRSALACRALACAALGLATASWSSCKDNASAQADGAAAVAPSARPEVHLPGVDTSPLTPRERRDFSEYVQELPSPCSDVAVPIAQCVLEKRDCPKCVPAARFVMKAVRSGRSREQLELLYKNRYDPATLKTIPIDGSPTLGPSDAPVTIVEFADFQCPVCQGAAPIVEKVVQDHKDKIRFVYKLIALSMHPRAEPAARAAIAAMNQGKFWEFHHRLFETQALEPSDLDKDARALGLDLSRFQSDQTATATNDRLDRDKQLFDDIHATGTPTIFVNGRDIDVQSLEDWVVEELGGEPTPSANTDAGSNSDAGKPDASALPQGTKGK